MTDEQWPTLGYRCWEDDGGYRWRWDGNDMQYCQGGGLIWHTEVTDGGWATPDELVEVAKSACALYPNFREVTPPNPSETPNSSPPPDLSRRVAELEAANKWLAELLTEALPYVEEVEAHHKPGRNKLGKMIRVAVADQVTPK